MLNCILQPLYRKNNKKKTEKIFRSQIFTQTNPINANNLSKIKLKTLKNGSGKLCHGNWEKDEGNCAALVYIHLLACVSANIIRCFNSSFSASCSSITQSAVKAKLLEICGDNQAGFADDELPEYVMIMVANKKSKQQMISDLKLFLDNKTELFVSWLHEVLQKLEKVKVPVAAQKGKAVGLSKCYYC